MSPQGKYWICTLPVRSGIDLEYFEYGVQSGAVAYTRGQRECGESGYEHWQFIVYFRRKCRIGNLKNLFGEQCHCELTRSDAARSYVWKDDTFVGDRFEFGELPSRRSNSRDWEGIWQSAAAGNIVGIDPQIRVCHYNTLRKIRADFARAMEYERRCIVFWGETGTGKSRMAWRIAGMDAYPKCPRSKFWDGYVDQEMAVIDEFRGKDAYLVLSVIVNAVTSSKLYHLWHQD